MAREIQYMPDMKPLLASSLNCMQMGQWHEYTTVVQRHYQIPHGSGDTLDQTEVWVVCVKCGAVVKPDEMRLSSHISTGKNVVPESASCTLSGACQWTDFVNSDPIKAIKAAIAATHDETGLYPQRISASKRTFQILRNHPVFVDWFKYSDRRPIVELSELGRLFGLREIGFIRGNDVVLNYDTFTYTFINVVA